MLTRITDAAAVEEADTRGLIAVERIDDRAEVRVAHPLYDEERRRRAPPTRLRRLRGLIATELGAADDCCHRLLCKDSALDIAERLPREAVSQHTESRVTTYSHHHVAGS